MDDLRATVTEMQRRLDTSIMVGTISNVDLEETKVRVITKGGVKSPWIPYTSAAAGDVMALNAPTVGEQVTVLCPNGNIDEGLVSFGGIRTAANRPADRRKNLTGHHSPFDGNHEIIISESFLKISGSRIHLFAGGASILIEGGKIKISGDVEITGKLDAVGDVKAGTVSLKTHVHAGVQSGGSSTAPPTP